jgi:hypothetical protein
MEKQRSTAWQCNGRAKAALSIFEPIDAGPAENWQFGVQMSAPHPPAQGGTTAVMPV